MDKIVSGNLDTEVSSHPETKGWFVGSFMDKYPDFKSDEVELKWAKHAKGDIKPGLLADSTTKTFVILIGGTFVVRFPDINTESLLSKQGDFVFYDASYKRHEAEALEDSLLLVVRWPSKKAN
jgi:hypothetical protein